MASMRRDERPLVMPLKAAVLWVSLGLVVFGGLGAIYGRFEEPIKEQMTEIVLDHPGVLQQGSGEGGGAAAQEGGAAATQSADQEAIASAIAEDAWGRLKFFHGHGVQMVLASFVAFLLIANLTVIGAEWKRRLTWAGLVGMTLYNIGWFFAGILEPFMGAEDAKRLGEFVFFIPFGVLTIAVWTATFVLRIKEYRVRGAVEVSS